MRADPSERRVAVAHRLEERIPEIVQPLAPHRPSNVHERCRLDDARPRTQKDRIREAEDRSRPSDTRGQREHSRRGEEGTPGEQPEGIADVGEDAHADVRPKHPGKCFNSQLRNAQLPKGLPTPNSQLPNWGVGTWGVGVPWKLGVAELGG